MIQDPTMLVTLAQASDHLRRDTTDDDADLIDKIKAASNIVLNYIGASAQDEFLNSSNLDTAGEPIIPYAIQAATLIMTGILYKVRDGEAGINNHQNFSDFGNLPLPVVALLYKYRLPTVV